MFLHDKAKRREGQGVQSMEDGGGEGEKTTHIIFLSKKQACNIHTRTIRKDKRRERAIRAWERVEGEVMV